jgi:hypothetical protein
VTFDESVRILNRGPRPGFDGEVEFSQATVVYSAHDERRTQREPGRARFFDAAASRRFADEELTLMGGETTQVTQGGANPGGAVGARRIMRLDGAASAYIIVTSADGETWLCYAGKADGVGEGMAKSETEDQAARIARLLEGAHDSPKAVRMRDEAWSKQRLQAINRANAAFWKNGGGNAA